MEILRASIAVGRSQQLALRYRSPLEIRREELSRYFSKSASLALCYQGFGTNCDLSQAEGAGRAAFLSCAYDVATDWREDDPKWPAIFEQIVRREASPELAEMALDLYRRDAGESLTDDGLERGIIAFRFVLSMMGLTEQFQKKTDIDNLGLLLQVVDDVLDYESDTTTGDLNCINSPKAQEYLHRLDTEMTDAQIRLLFPNSRLLFYVIRNSRRKAHKLLKA